MNSLELVSAVMEATPASQKVNGLAASIETLVAVTVDVYSVSIDPWELNLGPGNLNDAGDNLSVKSGGLVAEEEMSPQMVLVVLTWEKGVDFVTIEALRDDVETEVTASVSSGNFSEVVNNFSSRLVA